MICAYCRVDTAGQHEMTCPLYTPGQAVVGNITFAPARPNDSGKFDGRLADLVLERDELRNRLEATAKKLKTAYTVIDDLAVLLGRALDLARGDSPQRDLHCAVRYCDPATLDSEAKERGRRDG